MARPAGVASPRPRPSTTATPRSRASSSGGAGRCLIPMRRGRGASAASTSSVTDCDRAILTAGVERAVEDLDAVLAFVAGQPWADPARLLLRHVPRRPCSPWCILAADGRRARRRRLRGRLDGRALRRPDPLQRGHVRGGRPDARLPMLWLYSENDRNYGPAPCAATIRGFVRAGGTATLEMFRPSATTATSCCRARSAPGGPA